MGSDLYNAFDNARERYACANDILGYDLSKISFLGPAEKLRGTQFTQPAIFVHSIIIDEHLKSSGFNPQAVAGHSLGEFSAMVSCGVLSFEDALKIIKVRSHEMAHANENNPGTMVAIIGIDEEELQIICNQSGIVVPANINAPGQIVISGEIEAINTAIKTAKSLGIRKIIPLNVAGAFHSPLMISAREPLKEIISSVNFHNAKVPIYQNVNAKGEINSTIIQKNIIDQLEKPVLWSNTIIKMIQDGITNFFELGPGMILKGLNQRINKEMITQNFEKIEHLDTHAIL